jgi:hypothetical protein
MDALGGFALAGVTLFFAAFATAFSGLPVLFRLTVWTMSVSKRFAGMGSASSRRIRDRTRAAPALPLARGFHNQDETAMGDRLAGECMG